MQAGHSEPQYLSSGVDKNLSKQAGSESYAWAPARHARRLFEQESAAAGPGFTLGYESPVHAGSPAKEAAAVRWKEADVQGRPISAASSEEEDRLSITLRMGPFQFFLQRAK